jgi:cysteine-rich repeat protein
MSVATASDGSLYVTGRQSDNAFRIDPNGLLTEIIDSSGAGAGNTLNAPHGIAVDAAGNVYIAGFSSNNGFKIDPNRAITEIIDPNGDGAGHALEGPLGIAATPGGTVYIVGSISDNVFRIEPGGAITQIMDSTGDGVGHMLNGPIGVALDAAGKLYVTGRWSNNGFKVEFCGDGVIDFGEECDDANTEDGDCCSSSCQFEGAGSPCGDSSDTECTNPDSCNDAGTCLDNHAPPGAACGDVGVECRNDDSCDGTGSCQDNGLSDPGTACGDPSDTLCDDPDTCNAAGNCQPNFEPPTTACRPSAGVCDLAENCGGLDANCPVDAKSTAVCRASAGACDPSETCDGVNNDCPADAKSTALCRGAVGLCDVAENCNGTDNDCPADGFGSAGAECRADAGQCDVVEECSGTDPDCPPNGLEPNGTVCNDADICTSNDQCQAGICQGEPDICGDGMTQEACGEECDDGNNDDGDGCSALCLLEAEARPQDKEQQKCILELNKNFAKVAKTQGTEISKCIKDGSKDKLVGQSIEQCTTADNGGKVAQATQKTIDKAADKCASDPNDPAFPDFGVTDPNTVNRIAIQTELALIHEIFGFDLDEAIFSHDGETKAASKCQQLVADSVRKCQDAKLKEFNRCTKEGLKDESIQSSLDLQACMGVDPKGNIAKACDPVSGTIPSKIDKKCVGKGVDLLGAFASCDTDDPGELATCLDQIVECQVCLALNEADALDRDCDDFDDEVANESCP